MKKIASGLLLLTLVTVFVFVMKKSFDDEQMYVPRTDGEITYEQSIAGAAQWLSDRRRNIETGVVDPKDVDRATQQIAELRRNKGGLNLQWQYMGPDNIGGRCRAILIHPDDPNIIYAGGVSGGLWKSTTAGGSWKQIIYEGDSETDGIPNLNISNICRTVNGDIYFGTGEGFYIGSGTGVRGFDGAGIWKSSDGVTFKRLPSTWSDTVSMSKNTFVFVNKLAAHPTIPDMVLAATNRGLRITKDGGKTWYNPLLSNDFADDIKVCSKGQVMVTRVGSHVYVSRDGGDEWVRVSGFESHELPTGAQAARIEFAIAPTNSNFIYAQASRYNGQLLNVYKSEDAGATWEIIGPGGSDEFNPLGTQGTFNNTIKVYPDDKHKIILGGQYSIWTWGKQEGWNMRTWWNYPVNHLRYVHADQHEIRFHPDNPDIIYVGSDGGVSRSLDGGETWHTRNKFFGITQFYAIGFGPNGSIIGGTQDNGTLYYDIEKPPSQGLNYEYRRVLGGDGAYAEISQLNPNFQFATIYYGSLYRSETRGEAGSMATFFNNRLINDVSPGNMQMGHPFITPIALWENFYDINSIDTAVFSAPFAIDPGGEVRIESKVNGLFYTQTLEDTLKEGESIKVHDTYQSALAIGFRGSVWVTQEPHNLTKTPNWIPVIRFPGAGNTYETTQHLHWSSDGNILYVAVNNINNGFLSGSTLYRVKGFNHNRLDTLRDYDRQGFALEYARIARFNNRIITGLAVDPNFGGNLVITLGNYGAQNFVYQSSTAHVDPHIESGIGNFVNKQGNLPQMPVYDALILWNDSRKVIVGTEFGVYSTLDITASSPVWYDENETFDYVATYSLRQQHFRNGWVEGLNRDNGVRNHGHIWAGTHGRGIFHTAQFAGPVGIEPHTIADKVREDNLNVFPNPATDNINFEISLNDNANVNITIFDMQGRIIETKEYQNLPKGTTTKQINIDSYKSGIYIARMTVNNNSYTSRFVVK